MNKYVYKQSDSLFLYIYCNLHYYSNNNSQFTKCFIDLSIRSRNRICKEQS